MASGAAGYVSLVTGVVTPAAGTGHQSAPTSGETKVLWSSADNVNSTYGGARFKRLVMNITTSAVSQADGLEFQESNDGSAWSRLVAYTVPAAQYSKYYVATNAPYVRVRYSNSVATLTTWDMHLDGDPLE